MAHELTLAENTIFDALAKEPDFSGGVYRDGAPAPEIFASQKERVVFVFREPNLGGRNFDMDMRAQVRNEDPTDPLRSPGKRTEWWRNRVAALAHAVTHGSGGQSAIHAFERFCQERDASDDTTPVDHLLPFAFVQLKKTGGLGVQNASEIRHFAGRYRQEIARQLALYEPDLIIGCGRGASAPAEMIATLALPGHFDETGRTENGFRYWRSSRRKRPLAMLEFYHPSCRKARQELYAGLWNAVLDIRRR